MKSKDISNNILLSLFKVSIIAILLYLLFKLQSLLLYIAIAAVISLIGRPIVIFLKSKFKLGNLLSASVTIFVLVSILFGIISLFIPLLAQQGENLSLLDIDALQKDIEKLVFEVSLYFDLDKSFWESFLPDVKNFESLSLSAIPKFLNNIFSLLGGLTIGFFSVIFISFFLLKDSHILENSIFIFVNKTNEKRLRKSFESIKDLLSRYFLGLLLQINILLIIYSIVLFAFGIKNAFIIAFLCSLLNLIPYIGPIIAALLMMILSMTSNLDADFSSIILPKTIYVMIGFIIGQLIDNFFSQPYIFSKSIKSHPLEIFLIIIVSGTLFGPIGMIAAIPFYTSLKVILKEFLSKNKIVKSLTKDL